MNAVLNSRTDLLDFIKKRNPDILCLSETKMQQNKVEPTKRALQGHFEHMYFNCSQTKKGQSGVAILSKIPPLKVTYKMGDSEHDDEGRVIVATYDHFHLVSAYVPNAGVDGLKRLAQRTQKWDVFFREQLGGLNKDKPVILAGDLNCAHREIDIHNPKLTNHAGFTPEERNQFSFLMEKNKLVDTFRHFFPDKVKYSFRPQDRGWRLDYFLVSQRLLSSIDQSDIDDTIRGSDHVPIIVTLDIAKFKRVTLEIN